RNSKAPRKSSIRKNGHRVNRLGSDFADQLAARRFHQVGVQATPGSSDHLGIGGHRGYDPLDGDCFVLRYAIAWVLVGNVAVVGVPRVCEPCECQGERYKWDAKGRR